MARTTLLILVSCLAAFAQAFEVAEVKVNKEGSGRTNVQLVNGQVRLTNATMRLMIAGAWNVNPDAVTGAPSWIDSEHFDLAAKSTPDATETQLRAMLKALLAERFKLEAHVEERPTTAYALVVAKGGPKLKESTAGKPADQPCAPTDGAPDQIHLACEHLTMADLAKALPRMAPRYITMPVVDKTALNGWWAFQLDWTPMAAPAGRGGDDATIETAGGYTVFDALAKIGLKLEKGKLPVPIVIVDRIDRLPSE
jgi:uncharacterized protein (TIGR03435 family)